MKKQFKIWTLVSPSCHEALAKIATGKRIPVTKVVMDILTHKLPTELTEDYNFNTLEEHKIVISLDQREQDYITKLTKQEKVKQSKLLRMIIYTYLKNNGYISE